jgi:hypothetical protein
VKEFEEINAAMAYANCVQTISVTVDRNTGKSNLELLLVERPFIAGGTRVLFRDVADLKCALALGGGWTQIQMLGIREKKEGYERPYVVKEIEYDTLSFRCVSAELLDD